MTPGGYDLNQIPEPRAIMRSAAPMGLAPTSHSTSTTDARQVNQTIHAHTTVTGVEKPKNHARQVGSSVRAIHQMSLQNAQSAIA